MIDRNFVALCHQIAGIDLLGNRPPAPLWGRGSPTEKWVPDVRAEIKRGLGDIPHDYFQAFIDPLTKALHTLVTEEPNAFETLAAAVSQHDPNYEFTKQLRRFLAVVSDLYRSFLNQEERIMVELDVREKLPPLAAFKYVGEGGPFTYEFDDVKRIGAKVGVVSLPATFADHPLLWTALAHETGGHDVVHAIPRLFEELQGGVGKALANTLVPGLGGEELVVLWRYWLDEAVADVYGILNVGPAFGLIMAGYHAALSSKKAPRLEIPKVRMASADEHPPAILRIHLAIGVVESLDKLSAAKRDAYVSDLKRLARLCASGDVVEISGPAQVVLNMTQVPLREMQEAARQVGNYIAKVKLKALGDNSIQDIETWDDADEACAEAVRDALKAGNLIAELGDDAQLLAGATMYLLDHPDQYTDVTKTLAVALDKSFETDPIWRRRGQEARP